MQKILCFATMLLLPFYGSAQRRQKPVAQASQYARNEHTIHNAAAEDPGTDEVVKKEFGMDNAGVTAAVKFLLQEAKTDFKRVRLPQTEEYESLLDGYRYRGTVVLAPDPMLDRARVFIGKSKAKAKYELPVLIGSTEAVGTQRGKELAQLLKPLAGKGAQVKVNDEIYGMTDYDISGGPTLPAVRITQSGGNIAVFIFATALQMQD